MDWSTLKEFGVAGIAIGALTAIAMKSMKDNAEARRNYTSFVQENNHTTTDLVREATATMVEVKNSIENHNKLLELMINRHNNK